MKTWIGLALGLLIGGASSFADPQTVPTQNVIVYKEAGRFGGWPANHGIWSWDNEIVVGFQLGYFKKNEKGHAIDPDKPSAPRFARSLDGGRTWTIENASFLNGQENKVPVDPPGGLDFTDPNFALLVQPQGSNHGYSRLYYSTDRCKTWEGPFRLPTFGRKGIFARTNYLVNSKYDLMAFMTAAKENGREGRPFCVRTMDGGKTWKFVAWIGPEPSTPRGYAIMPSAVRLSPTELLAMVRRKEAPEAGARYWIEPFYSGDNGHSWRLLKEPIIHNGGNPASMITLRDGRIALTYGYRRPPYGIRARLSGDKGRTWSKEIILRKDGGCWDLGYPRTVQRPDGKILTVYYFNERSDEERYIAATIWDPGKRDGIVK